jgi:hypothetical protein
MHANYCTYPLRPILAPGSPLVPSDDITETAKPWEPFALNADVLRQLREWNKTHQAADKHLPNVLGRVAKILDSQGLKIALDAIPNDPIPAGGIVKGLVWIMVLGLVRPLSPFFLFDLEPFGARISLNEKSKHIILQFKPPSTSVRWPMHLGPPHGMMTLPTSAYRICNRFGRLFIGNSAGIFLIICSSNTANEICKWAYEQVVGHSFVSSVCFLIALQTSKGAFDDQLQTELKEKIDNATRVFLVCLPILQSSSAHFFADNINHPYNLRGFRS